MNFDFCYEWGDSAMIFTSDEVIRENHLLVPQRVTKRIRYPYIVLFFYTLVNALNKPAKYNHRSLTSQLSPSRVFSHLTKVGIWRNASTTSYLSIQRLFLLDCSYLWYSSSIHAYADWCKVDFSQWITTVSIDFSPTDIHGVGCKKNMTICTTLQNF